MMSPCMDNGKCTKRFPKPCQTGTITHIDGYLSYRRIDVDNGGQSYEMHLSNGVRVDIDNRCWFHIRHFCAKPIKHT